MINDDIYREFGLVNEKGEEFSFMDIDNFALLTAPNDLGSNFNNSLLLLSTTFILSNQKINASSFSGELLFKNYDNYKKLADYIFDSKELKLVYKIPYKDKKSTFFRNIAFKSLSKTELDRNGYLTENIFFDYLSIWYSDNHNDFNITRVDGELRWNFRWASRFMNYNMRSLTFNNTGHTSAAFYLEIDGYVNSPRIIVENPNGEVLFDLLVPVIINQYEKFIYNSIDGEIEISKMLVDGTTESLFKQEYIDITNNNIYKLPQGVTNIKIQAENDITNAVLKIYPYYKAV